MTNSKHKVFWAIERADLENWHEEASAFEAFTAEDAAKSCADEFNMDDDGDEIDVVVSEYEDGRDHKVFRVSVEIVREYDVAELDADDVEMPSSAPDANEDNGAPEPVDTRTLPLFEE